MEKTDERQDGPQTVEQVTRVISHRWLAENLKPGDIMIVNEAGSPLDTCLVTIEEVRSWGIQGFVQLPPGGSGMVGIAYMKDDKRAYIRLAWDQMVRTGGTNSVWLKESTNG